MYCRPQLHLSSQRFYCDRIHLEACWGQTYHLLYQWNTCFRNSLERLVPYSAVYLIWLDDCCYILAFSALYFVAHPIQTDYYGKHLILVMLYFVVHPILSDRWRNSTDIPMTNSCWHPIRTDYSGKLLMFVTLYSVVHPIQSNYYRNRIARLAQ